MSVDPGPQFHIRSLYESRAVRDSARLRVYNALLQKIYDRITFVTRSRPDICYCAFVIPSIIPGQPLVHVDDAANYLILRLNAAGLDITYTKPNLLFISWQAHEENYHKTMNPFATVYNMTGIAPKVDGEEGENDGSRDVDIGAVVEGGRDLRATGRGARPERGREPSSRRPPAARRVEDYVPGRSFF